MSDIAYLRTAPMICSWPQGKISKNRTLVLVMSLIVYIYRFNQNWLSYRYPPLSMRKSLWSDPMPLNEHIFEGFNRFHYLLTYCLPFVTFIAHWPLSASNEDTVRRNDKICKAVSRQGTTSLDWMLLAGFCYSRLVGSILVQNLLLLSRVA